MQVQRQRKRDSKVIYRCSKCGAYFSVKYGHSTDLNENEILIRHLEGTSTHQLADQFNCSQSKIYRNLVTALKKVPNSNFVTETVCDKFSGFLLIDGKYFKIKGETHVFIWAIDYFTHDIVWYEIASSENAVVVMHMFKNLKKSNYDLKFLICDDNPAFQVALRAMYPKAKLQLCIVHYLRNIQKLMDKEDEKGKSFLLDLKGVFRPNTVKLFSKAASMLLVKYPERKYHQILVELNGRVNLLTYLHYGKCPSTSNLIEGYNKHLEIRLKKLDGFKTSQNARLWLNAYVWYRRTKKLKHCKGKFKRLNGKVPLSLTAKDSLENIYLLKSL